MKKLPASAAILVGGKSTRFGSDKAYLALEADPLSIHLYRMLYGIFSEVFFVSGASEKSILKDALVLPDIKPEIGPLGGLATALGYARHPFCFVTACDMPFIHPELIRILWRQTGRYDVVIPERNGLLEPLAAFYHTRCLAEIDRAIGSGRYMLQGFWYDLQVNRIDMRAHYGEPELERIFHNINTPEDYRQALRMLTDTPEGMNKTHRQGVNGKR